jgi:transcription initiation factor TFIID TATA-box-binding protein
MRSKPEGYYIAFYKTRKFLITGLKTIEKIEEVAKRVILML